MAKQATDKRGQSFGWMNAEKTLLLGTAAFEAELSVDQVAHLESFAASALARAIATDEFNAADDDTIRAVWPALPSFDVWTPVVRAMRSEVSDYAAKCLRAAMVRVHGALPTAGTGTGEGVKGLSAKKSAKGIGSTVAKLTEQVAKIPAKDVNAALLVELADAMTALQAVTARLSAAVNE